MASTRYLVKVHSIEVSTLPVTKASSIVDLQCTSFCDADTKALALELSKSQGIINLLENEDDQTDSVFMKDVPIWGTCALAVGSYLVGAAARQPPTAETMRNINRASKSVADMAQVAKDLAEASYWLTEAMGKEPSRDTFNKIKAAANTVAELASLVKDISEE